jgi:nitric oxide reductase large subunit
MTTARLRNAAVLTFILSMAILWIALSWMGTAIYLAPLVARREPNGQRAMVNILFIAAVAVAVGSLAGQVLGIKGYLGDAWFWLGHQGWEYLELGRLWQILLFGGLIFWLVVVYRAIAPVLVQGANETAEAGDRRALIAFYVLSAIFVVAFFGFGLFYGRGTHLTIADFWRWFVVHIWVESIFEFFGVAVISLFLVTLGLVSASSAIRVAYLTAILVFISGIPGTAHHYFWYGGPSFWLAIALILFSWRGLVENRFWNDRLLAVSFWGFNGGLFLMFLTGLLPIGLSQLWYSYDVGFWFARSAAFYELPAIVALGTWRIVPDTIIILLGAFPLLYFLITTFPRLRATPAGKP